MRELLTRSKVIAVVGHSDNPGRTSYQIAQYLKRAGYKVYPVNPTVSEIDGAKCYPDLASVPEPIDIVNVFRRSQYLADIFDEAVEVGAKSVWAQLGVVDILLEAKAEDIDYPLVMDTCIKVVHARLVR
ncbi:MAG: CoA-binding protein [Chloroflexi bacterium]|nr:CoA-binding protein [Chloroflexota bacterium]NOG64272.1 CoA-binding protein [Chloroflexota bacterium]